MTMTKHTCGGTILRSEFNSTRPADSTADHYDYCTHCGAYQYGTDRGEAFPSGTDEKANLAAWDRHETRSPEAEAVVIYTYAARITDWRAGHVTVTEYTTPVATSADAMTRGRRLTDAEIAEWLDEVAVSEWAAPEWTDEDGLADGRDPTDLTLSIERAEVRS